MPKTSKNKTRATPSEPIDFIHEMTRRTFYVNEVLHEVRLPIEALLGIEYEAFNALMLEWASLPPEEADRYIEWLAPKMARFAELMRSNQARARAMRAKHKVNGHG